MALTATSLGRSGLQDWLVQRFTAVFLAVYTIFLVCFYFTHPDFDYSTWHSLFANPWMKLSTVLALISVVLHAWVGLWTVSTDYINCSVIRLFLQFIIFLGLIVLLAWGIHILWGV